MKSLKEEIAETQSALALAESSITRRVENDKSVDIYLKTTGELKVSQSVCVTSDRNMEVTVAYVFVIG